jgi:dTDP-4-amino-4,6-dideoxygalactose transaminase
MNSEQLAINGGVPVRNISQKPWPRWPIYDETEERALLDTLHSGEWWSVDGTQGQAFEQEFAAYHAAKHGTVCTNGTAALEVALRAADIGCGDEVIVPPYTFVATASAVLTVSATPVFVDIETDTLNIDAAQIEAAITPRTRAIIPAYIAGRPADMDVLLDVARRHDLIVIEDAAQAHGAAWRGTPVGALGDMGTFSFQASKNLNAGEGGIVLSNDAELAENIWSIINVGRSRVGQWYEHPNLGGNFRLSEFQSAILRTQLARLPAQTALRQENARYLRSLLSDLSETNALLLPRDDPRITTHAYHLFTFRYVAAQWGGRPVVEVAKAIAAEGVPCTTGYVPLYKEGLFVRRAARQGTWCQIGRAIAYPSLHLPACEQVCTDTLWLPQTLLLGTRQDMDDIAAVLLKVQSAWQ